MINFDCETCGSVEYGVLDGYLVAERLLEGIKFHCYKNDDGTFRVVVSPEHAQYFSHFDQEKWLKEIAEFCKGRDIWDCPKCGNDVVPIDCL